MVSVYKCLKFHNPIKDVYKMMLDVKLYKSPFDVETLYNVVVSRLLVQMLTYQYQLRRHS